MRGCGALDLRLVSLVIATKIGVDSTVHTRLDRGGSSSSNDALERRDKECLQGTKRRAGRFSPLILAWLARRAAA